MSGKTGPVLQAVLDIVIKAHPAPVRYDHVIAEVMWMVEPGRAHRSAVGSRNSMRRNRGATTREDTPTDRSIRTGRKRIVRGQVFEAVRRGRLNYYIDDSGFAMLTLGDPGTTGGKNARPKEWPTP